MKKFLVMLVAAFMCAPGAQALDDQSVLWVS